MTFLLSYFYHKLKISDELKIPNRLRKPVRILQRNIPVLAFRCIHYFIFEHTECFE